MKNVLLAMLFGVLLTGCGGQNEEVAKLTAKDGKVQVMVKPAEAFVDAADVQALHSGDSIKTGEAAKASLELIKDKSTISLGENSFLEIRNFNEKDLQQMSGTAIYKITPQNKELKINTQHGVATVLGTVLRVDTDEQKTVVAVEEGKVGFRKNGSQQNVMIEAGHHYATDFAEEKAQALDPITREGLFNFDAGLKPIINPR
ncbi:MAG: FecR family protein [Candidatus Riflebacteria bacterium]